MALNQRVVSNIDLQGDATPLKQALSTVGTELNKLVGSAGKLSKELANGAKAGDAQFSRTLKTIQILIAQATLLQNILDGTNSKRTGRASGLLDEQRLGKQSAAAAKLARDLGTTGTAAEALEKRLSLLNKRFAELGKRGQTVSRNDLAKQLRIDEALKQVNSLQSALNKLDGKALNTPARGNSEQMVRLRTEIEAVNKALLATAQNSRKSNFQPQINQIRALVDQYQKLISVELREAELSGPRALRARSAAQGILGQSDTQRLRDIQRAGSNFSFPAGVSNTVSQKAAEDALALSLQKRLRLVQMIQQAQDRGAPTRSVERLNAAYTSLNNKLGEQYKLLQMVNREQADSAKKSFAGQFQTGLGRAGIIAGAAIPVTGVFAVINAVQQATRFVVEYEAALKKLQAISGSTDGQMRRLADGINSVAANSNYSSLEITKAATVIAQAGFSAQETSTVLESAVTLATAAGVEPTIAVDTLTSALGAFQLQASESTQVVDTLVSALNLTKLSVEQVQAGIQYAAATANEAGISFQELTTIAATMANAGIRSGSTIGTGLRQLIVDLQTPTEDFKKELTDLGLSLSDVDVKALGFAQVVKNLTSAGFGAEAAYASFELRAAAAFLAVKGQIGGYDDLALAIAEGGTAAAAQEVAMDSLGSQFERFKNILGAIVSTLASPILDLFKGMLLGISSILEPISKLISAFGNLAGSSTLATTAVRVLGFALAGGLFGPLGAVIGALAGLVSGLNSAGSAMDDLRTKTSDASAAYDAQVQTIGAVDKEIEGLIEREQLLSTNTGELAVTTVNLGNKFIDLQGELSKTGISYLEVMDIMQRFSVEQRKIAGDLARDKITTIGAEKIGLQQQLRSTAGATSGIRQEIGSQLTAGRFVRQNPGQSYQGFRDRIFSALSSESMEEVGAAWREALKFSSANNDILRQTVDRLAKRKAYLQQIRTLTGQEAAAAKQIKVSEITTGATYVGFEGSTNNAKRTITDGLRKEGDAAGTGKAQLDQAVASLDADNKKLKDLQGRFKQNTEEWQAIQTLIDKNNEVKGRVTRAERIAQEEADKIKPDKAGAGRTLSGTEVYKNLQTAFPGIKATGYTPRSLDTQKKLYQKYLNGTGALAAKPGTSRHGSGNAIDITPIAGQTIDNVVAYIESLGLEVVEALVERNPSTGRNHWHVAWKPKTSSFAKQEESALESLKKARAAATTGAASSAIATILASARAGTIDTGTARGQLQVASENYKTAALAEFDTANPTSGLTGAALEEAKLAREQLILKLNNETAKFIEDLNRGVLDAASKAYDAAISALDMAVEEQTYNNEGVVRDANSNITRAGTPLNARKNADAGTQYYLQAQLRAAELVRDRAQVETLDQNLFGRIGAIADLEGQNPNAPENSEAQVAYMEKLTQATADYNEVLRQRNDLQRSINDRIVEHNTLDLEGRVKNGIAAWADSSGVMEDYSDILANNVGPALEAVTGSFSTMFSNILTGKTGLKSALAGMIASIADFVQQMIAKALALMAIKWFLRLVGLELGTDELGMITVGKVGKMNGGPAKQMKGGPAGKPMKFMGGGTPNPYISQGVTNRDSVPALLAQDEFVMRGAAVRDIGLDTVKAMNQYGAKGAAKMAQKPVMINPQAKQEVNVYVVKPEEKPQLNKNDIVLAIADDMLQGGQTKQLVRQISQGG